MTFNDEQKLFADSAWMLFNNKESILADPQIANIHVNMQNCLAYAGSEAFKQTFLAANQGNEAAKCQSFIKVGTVFEFFRIATIL